MKEENYIMMINQLRDALIANQVFHTPLALLRRGGKWDEYEQDAVNRTREVLAIVQDFEKTTEPNEVTPIVLALMDFSNDQLAAMRIAISWQEKLPRINLAFEQALKAGVIDADGNYKPAIEKALNMVIEEKMKDGTWQ